MGIVPLRNGLRTEETNLGKQEKERKEIIAETESTELPRSENGPKENCGPRK